MAVTCPSCGKRNGDDESSCSLCGVPFASHEATQTGFAPPREVTATDPAGPRPPQGESTGGFEANIRGIVVGGRIAGRYLVKEMLGRGGVAMVFRATDESLGQEIALKVFPNLTRQDPADLDRFKRELLVNRRISHVNVIRVHDFGTVGDDAYLTMELLQGGTLAEKIEAKPLPIAEAVEIAIGIAEGLQAAHQSGIVHRDVKPENVLFDDSGRPKLVDFGLARLVDATTHTRGFSGTPFYMSPEQANGDDITAQTDVYSLGVLLFELFTGQLPFFADSLVRIAMLHANEPPPKPSALRPGLPASLEQLILTCLAKKVDDRPSGAAAVAASLRKFRRDGGLEQARKLDDDPSFSTPRARPRRPISDRTEIHAPADAPPRRSNPEDPTFEKVLAPPASRETVMVRVNVPPAAPPSLSPMVAPSSRQQPIREQGSGPRPLPRKDSTVIVRDPEPLPKRPSELPLPSRGRRPPVWLFGAIALVVIAGVGYLLSGVVTRLGGRPSATPYVATPRPTATLALVASPRPTTEVLALPSPSPIVTRSATPTPKPAQSVVAVRPSPTAAVVVLAPSPTPQAVGRGQIQLTVIPWAYVFVDGEERGLAQGRFSVSMLAGRRVVRLENFDKKFKAQVTITVKDGEICTFPQLDLTSKTKPVLQAPSGC